MSSQLTLLGTPVKDLRAILDRCDLRSILTLRMTCHDLRNIINEQKPDSKLDKIFVHVNEKRIMFQMLDRNDPLWYISCVHYEDKTDGCMVTSGFQKGNSIDGKPKLLKNRNYVDVFIEDFCHILSYQKNAVSEFELDTFLGDEPSFVGKFHNLLAKSPFKAEKIRLNMKTQLETMQIFPCIDEESLQDFDISFRHSPEENNGRMTFSDELVNLPHWKNAKTATIHDFDLKKMDYCMHFDSFTADCIHITLEDMAIVKEKMGKSSTLTHIQFSFRDDFHAKTTFNGLINNENCMMNDGKEFNPMSR